MTTRVVPRQEPCLVALEGQEQRPGVPHRHFLGLDDDAWWSYTQDPVDATAGFFVAVTRAKQRVIFTDSPERGQRTKVAPLDELLDKAGMPRIALA